MTKKPENNMLFTMYCCETRKNLNRFKKIIADKKDGDLFSPEAVNELFRILHTVKGSSAMMSHTSVSTLAHKAEDMLQFARENPKNELCHFRIYDLLFSCAGYIGGEIDRLNDNKAPDTAGFYILIREIENVLGETKLFRGGDAESAAFVLKQDDQSCRKAAFFAPKKEKPNAYKAVVIFEPDCGIENKTARLLIKNLSEYATSIIYNPNTIAKNDQTSFIIRNIGLTVFFETNKTYTQLYDALSNVPCVKAVDLTINDLEKCLNRYPEDTDGVFDFGLSRHDFANKTAPRREQDPPETDRSPASARLAPVQSVFLKVRLCVGELSAKLHKQIKLELIGGNIKTDKKILELLGDPLLHLARNALDHGIESPKERLAAGKPNRGRVVFKASLEGEYILFTVSDDGRGIDKEKVVEIAQKSGSLTKAAGDIPDTEAYALIFLPGLTTRDTVTEFSGRGVGMDVVATNISLLGGAVGVTSGAGQGTCFTIKIPLPTP